MNQPPVINLIPLPRREAISRGRIVRSWTVGLALYVALVAIGAVAVQIPVHADAPHLSEDLGAIQQRIERAGRDRTEVEARIRERRRALETSRAIGEHPDWALLMSAIARSRNEDVVLESVDLALTKSDSAPAKPAAPAGGGAAAKSPAPPPRQVFTLRIIGYAQTPAGVFGFAQRIEQLGVLDRVVVKDTRSQKVGELNVVRFEIDAATSGAGLTQGGGK